MRVELHAKRLELSDRQLLLQLSGGAIALTIAPNKLDHVGHAEYSPVEHHLKVEVIDEH